MNFIRDELEHRIGEIETNELLQLHKMELDYDTKIKSLQIQREIEFNKRKSKVTIAMIENGYETDTEDE